MSAVLGGVAFLGAEVAFGRSHTCGGPHHPPPTSSATLLLQDAKNELRGERWSEALVYLDRLQLEHPTFATDAVAEHRAFATRELSAAALVGQVREHLAAGRLQLAD